MPNGCGAWAPGAHPRASASPGPMPSDARYEPSTLAMSAGAYASFPAATGVWVVNTTRARTWSSARSSGSPRPSGSRVSSSVARAG